MRILSFLILVTGLALAGGGVYYVNQFESTITSIQPEGRISIIVARRSINEHEQLRMGDLAYVDFPAGLVPHGAFTSVEALLGENGKGLRVASRKIDAREPIVESKIFDLNDTGGLITQIPEGWRAISLQVTAITSVGGFVEPNDLVDIVLNHSDNGESVSQIVLKAVRVLAVDQNMESESAGPKLGRTVTVLVEVRDALLLDVARRKGDLSLFLRGQNDPNSAEPETQPNDDKVTEGDLPGLEPQAKDERRYVWVWRGGVREKHFLDE